MFRITVLLVVSAIAASAQIPIHHPLGECGFDNIFHDEVVSKADVLDPIEFRVTQGDLCEEYTFDRGWEETMELRLGEGAEEYREWIELAVKIWNEAIRLPDGDPVIEISDEEPEYYRPSSSLWRSARPVAPRGVGDRESAIYFKASSRANFRYRGLTWVRWSGDRMTEADVFINTWPEEEYSTHLYETKLIVPYDDEWGAYGFVNETFLVILHELGHALGLGHVPVKGNIMNYNYMPAVTEQWRSALSSAVVNRRFLDPENDPLDEPYQLPFAAFREDMTRYMYGTTDWRKSEVKLFTEAVQLGAQEKMLLNCIYEF